MMQSESRLFSENQIQPIPTNKSHNRCLDNQCTGILIQHNHELICNECGWVINDLKLDQIHHEKHRDGADPEKSGFYSDFDPFYIGPNVGIINFKPKFLLSQKQYSVILGLEKGWESNFFLHLPLARKILIQMEYSTQLRNRILDRFRVLYKRNFKKISWGVIFMICIQEQCLQEKRFCPPTRNLIQIISEYNIVLPETDIIKMSNIRKLSNKIKTEEYFYQYLVRYFSLYPNHEHQMACAKRIGEFKNISGRAPRTIIGALIWKEAQKLGLNDRTQIQIGSCLNVKPESIRNFLKYMHENNL